MKLCHTLSFVSNYHIIISVTYTPSALHLSNREVYPYLWQIYPQVSHLTSPLIAIMKQFNWSQLKIITQDEEFFQQVCITAKI